MRERALKFKYHIVLVNSSSVEVGSFINVIQIVLPVLPVKSPNNGLTGNALINSEALILASFHLKISTPLSARTRQHSLNPATMSSFQVILLSNPYFLLITLLSLPLVRCGGS